jgi:hypothetical protein
MLCALLSHDKIPFSSHPIFGVNTAVGAADGERCLCRMARFDHRKDGAVFTAQSWRLH